MDQRVQKLGGYTQRGVHPARGVGVFGASQDTGWSQDGQEERKQELGQERYGVLSRARFGVSCARNRFPPEFRKGSIKCIPQFAVTEPSQCLGTLFCLHPSAHHKGLQSQNTNTGPCPAKGHPRSHQGPTLGSWESCLSSPSLL